MAARATTLVLAACSVLGIDGCGELPLVTQIREECANAPDRMVCEDAAYERAYEDERARIIYSVNDY